jgi:hypothetical protein
MHLHEQRNTNALTRTTQHKCTYKNNTTQISNYALTSMPTLTPRAPPPLPHTHTHTHTHTQRHISKIYCFSTTIVIRERASVLRYTYIACFVVYWLWVPRRWMVKFGSDMKRLLSAYVRFLFFLLSFARLLFLFFNCFIRLRVCVSFSVSSLRFSLLSCLSFQCLLCLHKLIKVYVPTLFFSRSFARMFLRL